MKVTEYQRIKDMREDRDIRQQDVADYLHVAQTAYSKYELGQRRIPIDILIKLARFYDVSIDYLVGETDVKSRYPEKKTKKR